MKTCINHVRHCACSELIEYRSIYYYLYRTREIVSDDQLEYMYKRYIILRGLYYCGLLSSTTIDRAYHMFVEIKKINIRRER